MTADRERSGLEEAIAAELGAWSAAGLERSLEGSSRAGLIDFTSSDYLGLARDPRLIAAARACLEEHGVGASAARLLRGDRAPHARAEAAVASWLGAEAALLLPSGWQANQAALGALLGPGDVALSDALNHASLIDALRLSRAEVRVFGHNDLGDLRRALEAPRAARARRRLIVVEHIYSMDGDRAPLEALLSLAEEADAYLYLDEAHAGGFFQGEVPCSPRIAARMITGGKALGVCGGFVVGSRGLIDLVLNRGRAFVFTTAPPPAMAAALEVAVEVVRAEPERAERALRAARRLRAGLASLSDVVVPAGDGPIVPVILGTAERALAASEGLRSRGFDARAIRPPTVAEGTSRLRLVCHADHDDAVIDALVGALSESLPPSAPRARAPRRGRRLVICGTDTDVGKTVASALLLGRALALGARARYLKPVQTGSDSDTEAVSSLAGVSAGDRVEPPIHFPLPASIDQAARTAGSRVTASEVAAAVRAAVAGEPEADWFIECAGGLRVPINAVDEQADVLVDLGFPLVLVARSGLGTLNHTLLSVEALLRRRLKLSAVLLLGPRHQANEESLRDRLGGVPLIAVPRFEELRRCSLAEWARGGALDGLLGLEVRV